MFWGEKSSTHKFQAISGENTEIFTLSTSVSHLAVRLRHLFDKLGLQSLRQRREQRVGKILFVLLVLCLREPN